MVLGSGSSAISSSGLPLIPIVVALIAGLVIGFVAAGYMQPDGSGAVTTARLSDEDKNFLVGVANAQVDLTTRLTAQQSAGLDWCTAGGGQWFTNQRQGQLAVTGQQAQQLQQQGGQVVQAADGNFLATVVLIDRSSCVVVPTNVAAGQQQAGQ